MYQVYKILDDDTLDSIALKMNIDIDEICRLNGMNVDEFGVGKFIVLPKQDNDLYDTYIVQSGDSLYKIAQIYNQDLDSLYAINGLNIDDYIYPNQEILIPKSGVSIYVTGDNDTLESVADFMGVSSMSIVQNNSELYLMPEQVISYKRD